MTACDSVLGDKVLPLGEACGRGLGWMDHVRYDWCEIAWKRDVGVAMPLGFALEALASKFRFRDKSQLRLQFDEGSG